MAPNIIVATSARGAGELLVSNRCILRSTTMLSGVVGCAFLAVTTAWADDLPLFTKAPMATVAPTLGPAVDALNEKLDVFGGSIANQSIYGVNGSITTPLPGQFGAQLDGTFGSLGGAGLAEIAGHWFWRDPSNALLGLYASETYWDRYGGINAGHVAVEGERYWGPFTLQGIVGIEFGGSASGSFTNVGPALDTYDVATRFFDEINLKYYFTNDISGYIGQRYLGGQNALALGGEVALPLGNGMMGSAFVEARVGEDEFHGIWGGLKLYFGPTDKPLIDRHRQEDPNNWNVDNLFGILNNHSTSCVLGPRTGHPGNCEAPSGGG